MKKTVLIFSTLLASTMVASATVAATANDSAPTDIQRLEKKIEALTKEIEALRDNRRVSQRANKRVEPATNSPLDAFAADMPVYSKAQPPIQHLNWTGVYAGLNIGYGQTSEATGFTAIEPDFFAPSLVSGDIPSRLDPRARGLIGGAQAGYNYQTGAYGVVGLEGDFSYSGIRGTNVFIPPPPGGFDPLITTSQTQKLNWISTFRARAGFLATPTLLAYVTGGLAVGEAVAATHTTVSRGGPIGADPFCGPNGNAYCSDGTASKILTGWAVGGGLEQMIGNNWSIKAEYLYYDLGNQTYTVFSQSPLTLAVMQAEASSRGQIGRLGVNYRFNTP